MIKTNEFLYKLQPVRSELLEEGTTPEEEIIILFASRTTNPDPTSFGIVIFRAGDEVEARKVIKNDPAVKREIFKAELFPYHTALGGY